MDKLNMKDWIGQTILNKKVISIPTTTHPGIGLTGKTVHNTVTNGQVHYEAIRALYDRYPAAAATVIMDLTVEAGTFGAEIIFPENEVSGISGRLLADKAAIDALGILALNKGRTAQYLKANILAAKNITDRPVLAGCIDPYSLAGRLYDMSEIMVLIYINPEAANTLLRKCIDFIIWHCMALKVTGVNGVVMAEPTAGLLPNEDCLQHSSVFVKEIVEKAQGDHSTVVFYNCGNTGNCTQAMVYMDAAAHHFGNKINMEEALKEVPADALAMDNLNPVGLFKMSSPEKMKKTTLQLLEAIAAYPNFVLPSGCDTPPYTPLANINAFRTVLEEFSETRNQAAIQLMSVNND